MLGDLLRESHFMEPDAVDVVGGLAAEALGAHDFAIYLVDYEQTVLVPVSHPHNRSGACAAQLAVDVTVAGRAFVTGQIQESAHGVGLQVWVPLVDGAERLGVIRFIVDELDDRRRQRSLRLGSLLAQFIMTKGAYTDAYLRVARRQPATLASELLWQLLPPLTFASRRVAIAGVMAPAYAIGGDAFDYAVNGDRVHLAIIDAMGHGMDAVVPAAVVLASLRHARRGGADLTGCYHAADRALRDHVGEDRFVTAQLAELDPSTGRLGWINAGHPPPALVRDARVVGFPRCAPSLPLGLAGQVEEVAEVALQPWDRLVFYTDGVTEGRVGRDEFGPERLADVLSRESLAGHGPAETMRRAAHAVLAHHAHQLRDDFTILGVEYRADQPDANDAALALHTVHDTTL